MTNSISFKVTGTGAFPATTTATTVNTATGAMFGASTAGNPPSSAPSINPGAASSAKSYDIAVSNDKRSPHFSAGDSGKRAELEGKLRSALMEYKRAHSDVDRRKAIRHIEELTRSLQIHKAGGDKNKEAQINRRHLATKLRSLVR